MRPRAGLLLAAPLMSLAAPLMSLAAPLMLSLAAPAPTQPAQDFRNRLPADEVTYFLLPDRFENGDPSNDRGGLEGGRLVTGFDPAA
jgi:hypothetical protein